MNPLPPQKDGQAHTMLRTMCGIGEDSRQELGHWFSPAAVQERIDAAVAAERERCAKWCDDRAAYYRADDDGPDGREYKNATPEAAPPEREFKSGGGGDFGGAGASGSWDAAPEPAPEPPPAPSPSDDSPAPSPSSDTSSSDSSSSSTQPKGTQ